VPVETAEKERRREAVRRALASGTVPRERPVKVWAGNGSGKSVCVVCERTLTPRDVEYELEFESRQSVTFDRHCHAVWEQERAQA
jgi:hypothetical protein